MYFLRRLPCLFEQEMAVSFLVFLFLHKFSRGVDASGLDVEDNSRKEVLSRLVL